MATIVIDPGHGGTTKVGGSDPNHASGPSGLLEKTVTLDVAKRTAKALQAAGHTVVLTRTGDTNSGLAARAGVAKAIKAPVFVSIHFNGFDHVTQGTETFCHTTHSARSAELCRAIQAGAVAATGLKNRNSSAPGGVKSMGLGVLKPSSHSPVTAGVLVEVSFMDVPAEDARLQTAAYKDKIANGLATGIANFVGAAAPELVPAAVMDVQDAFEAMNRPSLPAGLPKARRSKRAAGGKSREGAAGVTA